MNIEVSQITYIFSVAARLLAGFVFATFVFPLLIREAKVKNGLQALRWEMLITCTIIFFICEVGLIIVFLKALNFHPDFVRSITDLIAVTNSFLFLTYFLLKRRVYTQNYTPEKKALHVKFAKMEAREQKKNPTK